MAHRRAPLGLTPHRFFLAGESFQSGRVVFPREQAHQISRVLRLQAGDRVIVLDNTGFEYVVRLEDPGREVAGQVEERRTNEAEPPLGVTLYQGFLKAAKFELVLQKCTELGVAGFVPMSTARSIGAEPGPARQQRYQTIVREAAEQSRRGRLPVLSLPTSYTEAIRRDRDAAIVLWEGERDTHLADLLPLAPGRVRLFVGPEGGFTAEEAIEAQVQDATTATLGPRILRAETAAIAAAAVLLARGD